MNRPPSRRIIVLTITLCSFIFASPCFAKDLTNSNGADETPSSHNVVTHDTIEIDGINIFYREAGPRDATTLLLLHGYPTSSHMFRNLMRDLADKFHTLAPDYPGFGRSEQPPIADFEYTFDHMSVLVRKFIKAKGINKFSIYLMDYGAPIGYRIAVKRPKSIQGLIIQNGCAYEEGLLEFWDPIRKYWKNKTLENGKALEGFHSLEGLQWQYTHGTGSRKNQVSPDNWEIDLRHLTRPENNDIQLAMFYDYQNNVPLYPKFQSYFRKHQPPTLIVYGKNDHIFPEAGAHAYKKDLNNIDFNLYDAGHFALETHGTEIALKIREFLSNYGK
jgi:pimeloyl-ACP methyl ester carboxylesterase